jgi:rfaE bifunctional protein nucleotidyltransferase chain/domain
MINSHLKIIQSHSDLDEHLSRLKRPLVFTNGCFDILHLGHISYLEEARNKGASMIVALNSDSSVKRQNKGDDRPINPLQDRMAVMASLQCVDAVTFFDEDTPLELINRVEPDILIKGGDWPVDKIVGAKEVKANGGEVYSIEFKFQRSTTALLERIRAS